MSQQLLKALNPEITAEQEAKGTNLLLCRMFYSVGFSALKFVQPSHVILAGTHIFAYIRDAFSHVEFQMNPVSGEVRVSLVKLAGVTGRVVETMDTITVNLVPPPDFKFGGYFEDEVWTGVELIRLSPTSAQIPQSDGFVTVGRAVSNAISRVLGNTNSNNSNASIMTIANSSGSDHDLGLESDTSNNTDGYFHSEAFDQ
jgi:hypothetical protein